MYAQLLIMDKHRKCSVTGSIVTHFSNVSETLKSASRPSLLLNYIDVASAILSPLMESGSVVDSAT